MIELLQMGLMFLWIYRIKNKITQDGSTIEADGDFQAEYRDKWLCKSRWEQLDEDKTYEANMN